MPSPLPSSLRLFFSTVWLAILGLVGGCALASSPNSPSPPAPSAANDRSMEKVVEALSSNKVSEARKYLGAMPSSREKRSLALLIRHEEERQLLKKALADISRKDLLASAATIKPLYHRDPRDVSLLLGSLSPLLREGVLEALVETGDERLAIRTARLHSPHLDPSGRKFISFAYARWAQRREKAKRFSDALGLADQSRSLDPGNPLAQEIEKRVKLLMKEKVNEGLAAYRHRHLKKAIRLWQEALRIDPSQREPKKYILKAQAILKNIRTLDAPEQ